MSQQFIRIVLSICFAAITLQVISALNKDNNQKDFKCDSSGGRFCTVNCNKGVVNGAILTEELEFVAQKNRKCGGKLDLHISNSVFLPESFQRNWVNGNFSVDLVFIENCELPEIPSYAFYTDSFKLTSMLDIDEVPLVEISSMAFFGFENLQNLYLKVKYSEGFYFNPVILLPIAINLKYFEFRIIDDQKIRDPADLFKIPTVEFEHLNEIQLSYNNFENVTLNRSTFDRIHNLEILSLAGCNIGYLSEGVFDNFYNTIKNIQLSQNNLKTLPGNLENLKSLEVFAIFDNIFDCSCESTIFYYIHNTEIISNIQSILCYTPSNVKDTRVADLKDCIPTETSTPSTTSSTTAETTTDITSSTLNVSTSVISSSPETTTNEGGIEPTESSEEVNDTLKISCSVERSSSNWKDEISVKFPDFNFTLKENTQHDIEVIISNSSVEYPNLLWFTNHKNTTLGCQSGIIENKIAINTSGSQRPQLYTVCLISDSTSKISPFNCKSFLLKNLDKICTKNSSIGIPLTFSFLICPIIGALVVYFTIQRRPRLLRNSSKVFVPKESTHYIMVFPSNQRKFEYMAEKRNQTDPEKDYTENNLSSLSSKYILTENNYETIDYRAEANCYLEVRAGRTPPPLPKRRSE